MLKGRIIVGTLCCIWVLLAFRTEVSRKELYTTLAGESVETVDRLISQLENSADNQLNKAYIGALGMRKAGLIKGPAAKLKQFKEGAEALEKIIDENPANAEYRFLRLIIQENAPKILKYNKEIEEDTQLIISKFDGLDKSLQSEIQNYGKTSEVLKINEILKTNNR